MKNGIKISVLLVFIIWGGYWLWTSDSQPVKPPVVVNIPAKAPTPSPTPQISPMAAVVAVDPRLIKLQSFLDLHKCADAGFAQNYLDAADLNKIDWRLMPALSFKEESCKLNLYKNNLWGWESGATSFENLDSGIQFLVRQLSTNHYYVGKTTDQKLRTYNNHPEYAPSVIKIMNLISPD